MKTQNTITWAELKVCKPSALDLPADTHTIVALTQHYYGVARSEDLEKSTPKDLARLAVVNMVREGGKREWGYVLYTFGPGTTFAGVGGMFGEVYAEGEGTVGKVGVRGKATAF